jgi:AbrB family looped-hinge helix DNA binding protein
MPGDVAMKEILATLTSRGQVTVPAEVRRVLGLKPNEKIAFTIDDDQVRLRPAKFTLESAYRSVTPLNRPEDFDRMIQEAMEDHADEVQAELQRADSGHASRAKTPTS